MAALDFGRGCTEQAAAHIVIGWRDAHELPARLRAFQRHVPRSGRARINRADYASARHSLVSGLRVARAIAHRERQIAIRHILAAVEHNRNPASHKADVHLRKAEAASGGNSAIAGISPRSPASAGST